MRRDGWLLQQLPMGMTDDDFFVRFVSIFQEVASTLLEDADTIEHIVDPTVTPVPMLAWLGAWLGVSWLDGSLPEATQRRAVRSLGEALAWRGTRRGLTTILEAVTGGPVILTETGGVRRHQDDPASSPFVRIQVASTGWLDDSDFVRLVRDELPVSVAFQVEVAGRRIWPSASA
ncbi:phage tail protein [Acidimicrobium ferrooxidans DSM 10331]|uniref:Phage tail protein n=1 Tax=Acidimicrobium ferrooxidans (strain DSM 10331 / JCM 15462 / NBRC 103882 / ICP) TaxID=525909 RepID=C7M032_ACIFD|nr:phage tail protein [Acidimicrobium ferrooxidans]ACU54340.1 phage tail protein [Acidimicrobium ferrooxidans DSM 10331]